MKKPIENVNPMNRPLWGEYTPGELKVMLDFCDGDTDRFIKLIMFIDGLAKWAPSK